MGLNPPFGVQAALANKFIDKALEFNPKLIILIVPSNTYRYYFAVSLSLSLSLSLTHTHTHTHMLTHVPLQFLLLAKVS